MNLRAWAVLVLFAALVYVALLLVVPVPPCQKMWDATYSGAAVVDGRSVECFHGQIVRVK